ncbi:MAG: hypothetical protein KJ072_13530 [Verrucomicrobia bacterium]|nr:hypothetical protein [Verrucomicrobiota bacterium]
MKRAANNFGQSCAIGFILCFYSERLFWSVWRDGDSVGEQVITWLAYSAAAYWFLAVVCYFRVRDLWSACLAGAIYGWSIEGTLAPTLYGTETTAPFPLSLCVTGLSWHMLLSVVVGWFGVGRALQAKSWQPIVFLSGGVGVFWGLWATFQWHETPPVITPANEFFAHAVAQVLLLILAWWVALRLASFRPGSVGLVLSAVVLGAFYVQHVVRLGVLPLVVLPSVLALALVPLWRHRIGQAQGVMGASPVVSRLALLLVIPVVSTTVYQLAKVLALDQVPISTILFYWTTAPLGAALFLVAVGKCARRGSLEPEHNDRAGG